MKPLLSTLSLFCNILVCCVACMFGILMGEGPWWIKVVLGFLVCMSLAGHVDGYIAVMDADRKVAGRSGEGGNGEQDSD